MRLAPWLLVALPALPIACFLSIPDVPGETGSTGESGGAGGNGGAATSSAGGGDPCAGRPYPEMVKCDGPEVYYRFDSLGEVVEPKVRTLIDEMKDGKYIARLTYENPDLGKVLVPGLIGDAGNALYFGNNADRKFVKLQRSDGGAPYNAFDFPGQTNFSIEMWVEVKAADAEMDPQELFRKELNSGPQEGYRLWLDWAGGNRFFVKMERKTDKASTVVTAEHGGPKTGTIGFGESHHLVVTYDGDLCIYVDGEPTCVEDGVSLATNGSYAGINISYLHMALSTVDELAIYYKALTPAQIEAHYLAVKPPM